MVRQDYLIRMIQEIVTSIVNTLLNKHKLDKDEWKEYDHLTQEILKVPTDDLITIGRQELIDKYEADPDRMDKLELAAMTMLKMADEMGQKQDQDQDIILKAKLRQDGIALLKYVEKEGNTFSLQRSQLITLLEMNQ